MLLGTFNPLETEYLDDQVYMAHIQATKKQIFNITLVCAYSTIAITITIAVVYLPEWSTTEYIIHVSQRIKKKL